MRIQSAGTGLVDGAFFSVLGDAEAVEVDAAGLAGDEVAGVLAAGFEPQPAATNVSAHTKNTNFFINPPNKCLSWKSDLTIKLANSCPGLDDIAGESP
jgi:hypothetical protein